MIKSSADCGLYIDGHHVHAVELRSQFGEIQAVRVAEFDLSQENNTPWQNASAPDLARLAESLKASLEKENIHAGDVYVSLPSKDTIIRYFEMPLLPGRERKNSIRFEAQKYLPFEVSDLYIDFKMTIDRPERKMKVILAAIRKDIADRIVSFLRLADLQVRSIDPAPFSLLRVLNVVNAQSSEDVYAVVDIASKRSVNIIVLKKDVPLMVRSCVFPNGSDPMNPSQAEYEFLSSEINLSLNYFSKTFKNETIKRLIFCANPEGPFKSWGESLKQEFGISVDVINPLKTFIKSEDYLPGAAVAVGSGLRLSAKRPYLALDLLPKKSAVIEHKARPAGDEKVLLQKSVIFFFVIALALWSAIYFSFSRNIASKTSELQSMRAAHSRLIELDQVMTVEELGQKGDEMAKRAKFLENLIDKRIYWTRKLEQIAKTIPSDVRLTVMDYTDNEDVFGGSDVFLRLEGYILSSDSRVELSASNQVVAALKENTEFMQGIKDIRIISVQKLTIEDALVTKFVIDCSTAGGVA